MTAKEKKVETDPFEEAVKILQGYQEGLPVSKVEGCCEGCQVANEEKDAKEPKKVYYEAEY